MYRKRTLNILSSVLLISAMKLIKCVAMHTLMLYSLKTTELETRFAQSAGWWLVIGKHSRYSLDYCNPCAMPNIIHYVPNNV